jgi:uncharacterized protein YbbK (DUF523 family)
MTDRKYLEQLRIPTKDNPLRILMSACLTGLSCGYDGTANGTYPGALKLLNYDTVRIIKFCPEEFSFGTPKAKVLTEKGTDWTIGMIKASEKMLEIAIREHIELAVMMDISAACGSQVIYSGNRFSENKVYQIGSGVCAAQLMRNGFKVISQRDFASLEILYAKIDRTHQIDLTKKDHHEMAWYKEYFKME